MQVVPVNEHGDNARILDNDQEGWCKKYNFGCAIFLAVGVSVAVLFALCWKYLNDLDGLVQPNKHLNALAVNSFIIRSESWTTDDDDGGADHYFQIVNTFSYSLPGQNMVYFCNITAKKKYYNFEKAMNASEAAIGTYERLWVVPRHPHNCNGLTARQRRKKTDDCIIDTVLVHHCVALRFKNELERQERIS